jgi:hypothetical protein
VATSLPDRGATLVGKPRSSTRRLLPALLCVMALIGFALALVVRSQLHSNTFTGFMLNHMGILPISYLVDDVKSPDPERQLEALAMLKGRGDASVVPMALTLLKSNDDNVWFNAALYLGANNRPEAIPYLIKGLRHTAMMADPETSSLLVTLTGQNFGTAFSTWQAWYLQQPGAQQIDWTSHLGHAPRVGARSTSRPASLPTTTPTTTTS